VRPGAVLSDDATAGRRELIRSAVVLDGSIRLRVEIEPRGGASARAVAGGLAVETLLLGSVSQQVVQHATRPVVVVNQPATES
jgi:hypothetical protein